jgi:hypothetical protein
MHEFPHFRVDHILQKNYLVKYQENLLLNSCLDSVYSRSLSVFGSEGLILRHEWYEFQPDGLLKIHPLRLWRIF